MKCFTRVITGLSAALITIGCSNDSPLSVDSNGPARTATAITLGADSYCAAATVDNSYCPWITINGNDRTYAFVTAANHNMYYKIYNQGGWSPTWDAMPAGSFTGMIATVFSQDELVVFSKCIQNNRLAVCHYYDGWWSNWSTTWGLQISGDIIVKPATDHLCFKVMVKNTYDNKLWINTRWSGQWYTWGQIPDCPIVADKYDLQYMGNETYDVIVTARVGGPLGENIIAIGYDGAHLKWTNWVMISTYANIGDLAMASNKDGRVELFAIHTDHSLWHRYQTDVGLLCKNPPIGNWSNWEPLTAPNTCNGHLTATTTGDGRIEVFFDSYPDGRLRHIYQNAPNSAWSQACDFENGTVQTTKPIACAPLPDKPRMSVFAINPSNTVLNYSNQHSTTEWWWDPFSSLGLQ